MAEPELKRGTELLLYRESDTPGTFNWVCGITNKSVPFTKNLAEALVPDCDEPSATPWVQRSAMSRTSQFTGDGVMAMEYRAALWADYESDEPRNWRAVIKGVGYWGGAFHLASYNPSAAEGDPFVKLSLDLQSSGRVQWTDDLTAGV